MRTTRLAALALLSFAALAWTGVIALDMQEPADSTGAATHASAELGSAPAATASVDHGAAAGQGTDHAEGHDGGHASPVVPVLALLLIVILAAKIGGAVMEKIGQPGVLGELVFGVILGNLTLLGFHGVQSLFDTTIFGAIPAEDMIEILGEIGVILLLFEVGLESNIKEMMSVGASSLLVATFGVVAPFFLGWGVGAWLLPESSIYVHVFLGATLCATSVGITARVLKDLNKINLRESKIVLGAAVIDDVMGLVVLAVVSGIIVAAGQGGEGNGVSTLGVAWIVGKALLFLVGAVIIGQWAAPRIFRAASKLRGQHLLLTTSLMFLFLLSYLANKIGLATIVGAFAAGLVLDEVHYKEFKERGEHSLEELLHPLAGFLVPIFFVHMGYKVDLSYFADRTILGLAAGLTVAAIIGKQVCSFGVVEKGLDKLSVGIGMVPRGEVGLIFASIGLSLADRSGPGMPLEPVISQATYGAVVIMVIVTTLITPPALKWSLNRPRGYEGASDDEMARIAAAKREKRKEYFRSRSRTDQRPGQRTDQRRDGGRSRRPRRTETAKETGARPEGKRSEPGEARDEGKKETPRSRSRRRRRPRRRRGGSGTGGGGSPGGTTGGGRSSGGGSRRSTGDGSSRRSGGGSKGGGKKSPSKKPISYSDST